MTATTTSTLTRASAATAALAVLGLAAACGNDDDSAAASSGPSSSAASTSTSTATATATSTASATDAAHVQRGAATGERDVDVKVRLSWRGGAVDPAGTTVAVERGDRVEVLVSSDQHADIDVSGHPDDRSDVDPDEPEDVDFTITEERTVVSIGGTTLATFTTS
ncbi:hypothetical protein D9V37_17495 [Nocardioides mangrovicus]|uniref:Uncharacterized protein n=1 Tax=Nocardioides mangrovicus TaxID=2478913 RepID=A0A3L8NXC9_9ACTN|nr:hypothetical protein [Nocardioides mangrovicus]RLV47906.1 hypothetical protein D9V37_17495 [Nocardioides mangrovicus]